MVTIALYAALGFVFGILVRMVAGWLQERVTLAAVAYGKVSESVLDDIQRRLDQLQKVVGYNAQELLAWEGKVKALEDRDAEQRLIVMDTAEKVAARLEDRTRKRAAPRLVGHELDEEEPAGAALARMRAAEGRAS